MKYNEIEKTYFPYGHTFIKTRDLLNRGVYTRKNGDEYWDRARRCTQFCRDWCEYMSTQAVEYRFTDDWQIKRVKIFDGKSSYHKDNTTEICENDYIEHEQRCICVDEVFKLNDCLCVYGECDKKFDRLFNREYNHVTGNPTYNSFKHMYDTMKNNELCLICPYMSWIDNNLCNKIENVPNEIIYVIAAHCYSIINTGKPMCSKQYDTSIENEILFKFLIDLISKMFTFKCEPTLLKNDTGELKRDLLTGDAYKVEICYNIRRRICTNPYSTTFKII